MNRKHVVLAAQREPRPPESPRPPEKPLFPPAHRAHLEAGPELMPPHGRVGFVLNARLWTSAFPCSSLHFLPWRSRSSRRGIRLSKITPRLRKASRYSRRRCAGGDPNAQRERGNRGFHCGERVTQNHFSFRRAAPRVPQKRSAPTRDISTEPPRTL